MTDRDSPSTLASAISAVCRDSSVQLTVAESLTGGLIASDLAAAPHSDRWFAGGIVAYASRVKYDLLDVPRGPVISQISVETMARTACRLMGADAAVAVSGAGGPEPQEGKEPGTTWIAVVVEGDCRSELHHFHGEPKDILDQTRLRAFAMLLEQLRARSAAADPPS